MNIQLVEQKLDTLKNLGILPALFRSIAGNQLSECKPLGISYLSEPIDLMTGENSELTEQFFYDALAIITANEGSTVQLVSKSAEMSALLKGCSAVEYVSLENQRENISNLLELVDNEEPLESYTEDSPWDTEEEFDFEEEEEYEEVEIGNENEEEEIEDEVKEEPKTENELESKIESYYSQYYIGIVNELLKRYTSLFSSGYEVIKPFGILTRDGVVKLSGNSRVVAEDSVSSNNMYALMQKTFGFVESDARSISKISSEIYASYKSGANNLMYFPNKLLEFAYGRVAPDGDNQDSLNTYTTHSDAGNWNGYKDKELSKAIKRLVKRSVTGFVVREMEQQNIEDYRDSIIVNALSSFLKYLQDCLSACFLLVDYKFSDIDGDKVFSSFKLRLCDPNDNVGRTDLTPKILQESFMGGIGDVPFSYEPRIVEETFVKEYAHEFNHDVSQAMPLFAYKAMESLKAQGIDITFENLVLGMFEDGSILRNGANGIDLKAFLAHIITAGSRAGKGVMTLNIIASALASNKVIPYLDRKPDMASLFKYLCPEMFVINGGGYSQQYDNKYKQFTDLNSMLNLNNIPKIVEDAFNTTPTWDELGDIIYMRSLKLWIGIIVARAEGKFNDPNFGGDEGICLVVDEFKNFQDSFSVLATRALDKLPPTTLDKDRLGVESGKVNQAMFNKSYNNGAYYALSFLNSMAEDLKFLSEKTDAGFNQEEISKSDIFVIGQSLEKGMLDRLEFSDAIRDSASSLRYRSPGGFGLKGYKLGTQSIPFNYVSFKPCDAFFGRNMDEGRSTYLAQTIDGSKAKGRLDDKASNFAYMPTFTEEKRKKIVGGRIQENVALANECTYFKPFLILNTGDPSDDCVTGMISRCKNNGGITKAELVAENPGDIAGELNSAIGFEDYIKMAGITNYVEVLKRSTDVANYVVANCLGYQGSGGPLPLWFQFITDLRPEWLFTIKDISEGAKGMQPVVTTPTLNPILEEFMNFNPEYFTGNSSDLGRDLEEFFDGEQEVSDVGDYSNFEDAFDFSDEATAEAMGDNDYVDPDEEIDLYQELEDVDIEDNRYDLEVDSIEDPEMAKIMSLIEELRKLGVNVETGSDSDESQFEPTYERVDNPTSFESEISRNGFDEDIDYLANLINLVTSDIIEKFGGVKRITSFKVVGGSIVVNGYFYRCKIGKEYTKGIPYDIVREFNSGNISKLFNYGMLLKMHNIRDMEFDSTSFVYDYISPSIGFAKGTIGVDRFFETFSTLQVLTIGRKKFTRENFSEKIKNEGDMFYKPRKATQVADASERVLNNVGQSSWGFTKDLAKKKNLNLVVKFLGVAGAATVTGAAFVGAGGTKLGRKVLKGAKSLGREVKNLFD